MYTSDKNDKIIKQSIKLGDAKTIELWDLTT